MRNKILIADDKRANRFVLSQMVEEYEIIEAVDGKEAIGKILDNYGELAMIILDVIMPVMDGIQVLEVLKEKKMMDKVPVVIITEDREPEIENKIYKYNIADMIVKPVTLLSTTRKIHVLLKLYKRIEELEQIINEDSRAK